jgi:predicted nucleic-acid-binding protein
MIGLDTNVLMRYIVQDDAIQAKAATRLIETRCQPDEPGFISLLVLTELSWVLSRAYEYERQQISGVIEALLLTTELRVERPEIVRRALLDFDSGTADFADCLIAVCNTVSGCQTTYTFDKRASRLAGFSLVK